MEIKARMRYHFSLLVKILTIDDIQWCWEYMEMVMLIQYIGMLIGASFPEDNLATSIKFYKFVPTVLSISLLGIYLQNFTQI